MTEELYQMAAKIVKECSISELYQLQQVIENRWKLEIRKRLKQKKTVTPNSMPEAIKFCDGDKCEL